MERFHWGKWWVKQGGLSGRRNNISKKQKKKDDYFRNRLNGSGSVLASRAVASQVLSALKSLTSVFGMRTGGTSSPLPPLWYLLWPKSVVIFFNKWTWITASSKIFCDQALDLLVSVSWIHYCTYTSDLSTLWSSRGLTILWYGISYLVVSFTLRCFQRLSRPHFATRPCRWRDNRCTIGASTPVLSY